MADSGDDSMKSIGRSGEMIFMPILEGGVFRFDCSENDRNAADPSLSFANSKAREVSITTDKVPSHVPSFECLNGQQIVKLKVSHCIMFLFPWL